MAQRLVHVACQLVFTSWAVRWNDDAGTSQKKCRSIATPTDSLDFRSSSFEADFSFLRSRNFYISRDASCAVPLEAGREVPKSLRDKEVLLEQRYAVKQLKEGFEAVTKQKVDYWRHVGMKHFNLTGQAGESQSAPAVELHVYPEDCRDAQSRWKALVVPRVRSVFGETLYLCEVDGQCVAEVHLEPLPFRFFSILQKWQPFLERIRSSPHHLVLFAELVVMAGAVAFLGISAYMCLALWRLWPSRTSKGADDFEVPKHYQLLQHAWVYDTPRGVTAPEPLNAGAKILVQEVRGEAAHWLKLKALQALALLGFCEAPGIWARLDSPHGWILISDLNGDRVCSENAMPPARFVPSEQLLPSLVLFCRSCLILAACNVSALYFLVQQGMNSAVLALALGMGIAHCLVLHQKLASWTAGIRNDQALEEGCLLRSPEAGLLPKVFGALAVVLLVGTGVAVGSAFAVVLMALALHTQQLHAACAGLAEWREPQIRCKEYHKVATELLPQSVELPQLSKNRALKLAGTHYFAACLVILAATALGLAALDSCQRRGELVDFSFDRGHLIYPAEGQAFHSTLLLDETVDSVVLSIQAGQNTQQIQLSLEHPLLAVNESLHTLGKEKSGEFQLFLPAGPLYSRISLTALAMGSLAHTSYVFHVLRRGDAVKVSIQGSFDPKKYPGIRSQFEETRRLSYLLEHPNWYIPDISRLNTNFAVSFSPVIFAPLVAQARASADAMGIADSCDCGNDTAGYGNACAWQKFTNISGSGARCIFSYKTLPELVLHQPGSVAGDSFGLASWLADVSVSGRSVAFLPWAGNDRGTTAESGLIYFNPEEASDSERRKKLEVTFTVSMPLQPLIGEPAQLLIATTADPTDAEATSIPVALIPHAPPIRLQPTEFLTPAFDMQDMQKDYAWCSWETVHQMTGHVEDERFAVEARRIDTKEACEGDVRGMEFQAVRVGSCMDWCGLYTPRAETYDLAVVRSGLRCLKNAVVANNFEVLQRVMSGSMLSDDKKACVQQLGLLGDAIRRNRTAAAKTLVEHKVDPSKASLGEMPLAIAAEVGNTKTLNFLLAQNVSVDQRDSKGETALFAASRHCRLESVKLLLGHHASANAESRQRLRDLAECNETVLVAVLKGYDAASCSAAKALDGVVKLLEQHGANFQARGCDFEGNMLKHSLVEQDLTVMRLLLERRVDVTGAYSEELVREMLTLVQQLQPSFLAAALKMLKEKGMDLDQQAGEYKETLLTTFALMCKVELVRVCLEEGASPSAVNGRGINASAAAAASRCRNKTAEAELLQLLADHSSSGDP